jgi:hypothetical protein
LTDDPGPTFVESAVNERSGSSRVKVKLVEEPEYDPHGSA